MKITKAKCRCPVCSEENLTDKIKIFQEYGTTVIQLFFNCCECGTYHEIKIDSEAARKKLGECFGCISNTGDFVCRPECEGCGGTKNYKCGVLKNE